MLVILVTILTMEIKKFLILEYIALCWTAVWDGGLQMERAGRSCDITVLSKPATKALQVSVLWL